jgi:hypothetical protein
MKRAVAASHGTTVALRGSGNSSWSAYLTAVSYAMPPTTSERESSTPAPPYMFSPLVA